MSFLISAFLFYFKELQKCSPLLFVIFALPSSKNPVCMYTLTFFNLYLLKLRAFFRDPLIYSWRHLLSTYALKDLSFFSLVNAMMHWHTLISLFSRFSSFPTLEVSDSGHRYSTFSNNTSNSWNAVDSSTFSHLIYIHDVKGH